jgi:hypothetical protein
MGFFLKKTKKSNDVAIEGEKKLSKSEWEQGRTKTKKSEKWTFLLANSCWFVVG